MFFCIMARKSARPPQARSPQARSAIVLRLTLSDRVALGPGKAALMEQIRDTGSIAAAARQMGMSYQRAHDLVSALNVDFQAPLVETAAGGMRGGGARLSPLGEEVLAAYREMEALALSATEARRTWLRARLAKG